MQHPWKQFATNYLDQGNYQNVHSTQPAVHQTSQSRTLPSYNRSPAPFHPNQASSPSHVSTPYHLANPSAVQQSQPTYSQGVIHSSQVNGFHNDGLLIQTPAAHAEQDTKHQQQWAAPQSPQANPFYQLEEQPPTNLKTKNAREDPDIDEDFPSYKELRNVFVRKQNQAALAERRSQTLPRQRNMRPSVVHKPPPSPILKRNFASAPASQHWAQSASAAGWSVSPPSPQGRRRSFSQLHLKQNSSKQQQPMQQPPLSPSGNYKPPASPTIQSASNYQEIPVHHIRQPKSDWKHVTPSREAVKYYEPPVSLTFHDAVDSGPRVVITSNSPCSPQKAIYRGSANDQDNWLSNRRASVAQSTLSGPLMSSTENKPRRRASYAEIMITHNSLPKQLSHASPRLVQRSVSQTSHRSALCDGWDDNIELFPRQRRYNTLQNFKSSPLQPQNHYDASPKQEENTTPDSRGHGYSRVNMHHTSMEQMLYPKASPFRESHQRQAGSWTPNSQPVIATGPQAVPSFTGSQPGKSAAHLQYNSPMVLYSVKSAQQSLAGDHEAHKLLKIVGPSDKSSSLTASPTLQAVLREDSVKRQTGDQPSIHFYHKKREYGPGYGPLRQYEEKPDTVQHSITSYNAVQDRSLTYPMWN